MLPGYLDHESVQCYSSERKISLHLAHMLNDWKDSHVYLYGLEMRPRGGKRLTSFAGQGNQTNTRAEGTVHKEFVQMSGTA